MISNNARKEAIASIIAILVLIVSVIGVSYAVWGSTFSGNKTNSISTGYISFTYTEGENSIINIDNALPTSDNVGKVMNEANNQFDFTISATFGGPSSIDYEIYATPIKNTLEPKFVKVYLTDKDDKPLAGYTDKIPTYTELPDSSVEGSKRLYSGALTTSGATEVFKLRVWLSDTYKLPASSQEFSFKVNVSANA